MKKILIALVSMLTVIVMCFAIAGCATNVSGKTFVFDSIEIQYDDSNMSETEKGIIEDSKSGVEKLYKDAKYEFSAEDDTVKRNGIPVGKYTQDGGTVTIKEALTGATVTEFTVSGKKLKIGDKKEKYTFFIVFKAA